MSIFNILRPDTLHYIADALRTELRERHDELQPRWGDAQPIPAAADYEALGTIAAAIRKIEAEHPRQSHEEARATKRAHLRQAIAGTDLTDDNDLDDFMAQYRVRI